MDTNDSIAFNKQLNCLLKIYPVSKSILNHVEDKINCRAVCRDWNNVIRLDKIFLQNSCILFNGESLDTNQNNSPTTEESNFHLITNFFQDAKFLLENNVKKVVLHGMNDVKLNCFLRNNELSKLLHCNLMVGVEELVISSSKFSNWDTLFELFSLFSNLDKLCLQDSYFNKEFENYGLPTEEFLSLTMNNPIWRILELELIFQNEIKCQGTEMVNILPLFQSKLNSLDNLNLNTLKIQLDNYMSSNYENVILIGNTIGRLIKENVATLQHLKFHVNCKNKINPNGSETVLLEQAWLSYFETIEIVSNSTLESIDIRCPDLSYGVIPRFFENIILYSIFYSNNLIKLNLAKFDLYHTVPHILEQLVESCEMKLGIILRDSSSQLNETRRNIFKSYLMTSSLNELEVHWRSPDCDGFNYIFPIINDEYLWFEHMDNLSLYFEGPLPDFTSFNIDEIVFTFPNLCILEIHDKFFTKATILDNDLQQIMAALPRLRKICLDINLSLLTDAGITGRQENIERANSYSFSNLRDVKEIILRGLSDKVTNKSALFGFNGLTKLKYLEINGNTKIDETGVTHLRSNYKEKFGCQIVIGE